MIGNTQEDAHQGVTFKISEHKDKGNLESSKRSKAQHTGAPTKILIKPAEAWRQLLGRSKALGEKTKTKPTLSIKNPESRKTILQKRRQGAPLVVQQLRLHTSCAAGAGPLLAWGIKSHKLWGQRSESK